MADIEDIIGKKKQIQTEVIEIDGMCGECYWPFEYARLDRKANKLTAVCKNEHQMTIPWQAEDG